MNQNTTTPQVFEQTGDSAPLDNGIFPGPILSHFLGAVSVQSFYGVSFGTSAFYLGVSGAPSNGDLLPSPLTQAYAVDLIADNVYLTINGGTTWTLQPS